MPGAKVRRARRAPRHSGEEPEGDGEGQAELDGHTTREGFWLGRQDGEAQHVEGSVRVEEAEAPPHQVDRLLRGVRRTGPPRG